MKTVQTRTLLIAVVVFVLALLVLGMVLQSLVGAYLMDSAFSRLDQDSQVLADLVVAYYADDTMDGTQFLVNLDLTTRVSGRSSSCCGTDCRDVSVCSRTAAG